MPVRTGSEIVSGSAPGILIAVMPSDEAENCSFTRATAALDAGVTVVQTERRSAETQRIIADRLSLGFADGSGAVVGGGL